VGLSCLAGGQHQLDARDDRRHLFHSGGRNFVLGLIEGCRSIAELEGYGPRPSFLERIRAQLTAADSPLTASMYRDTERNAPIEADHIIRDLLRRGERHPLRGQKILAFESRLQQLESL
jgi:2-dehydropantoate 2-reductase